MIKVYHLDWNLAQTDFRAHARITVLGDVKEAAAQMVAEKYTHVADVDNDNLESAYRLTNHIVEAWQENDEVTPIGEAKVKARSSSVGDVMVLENGDTYLVAPFGFEKV